MANLYMRLFLHCNDVNFCVTYLNSNALAEQHFDNNPLTSQSSNVL